MNDKITPEALEAAGWVRVAWNDRYDFEPYGMDGPELAIWGVGRQAQVEISIYCNDASQNVTIGYAITMSEINAITTVAKRTMRKE